MVHHCLLVASIFAATVIEGEVPAEGAFFKVPFEVAPGAVEIEVRHDDLSNDNILDWGLLQPDGGFRGWGGGNAEPAVVGLTAASRSYLSGPLPSGTWNVLVGKALIAKKPGRYRLEVDVRSTATLSPQAERTPYVPAAPLESTARWYAGDLHVHSLESGDARPTLEAIAQEAERRGLDFIALSDHNTVSHLDFMAASQKAHPRMLWVPSVEFTTYGGHANAFGATRPVPFWLGMDGVTLDTALDDFAAQGAVVTINHPTLDLGSFCIGCAWTHPLRSASYGAIEVGVGGWNETGSLFDEAALVFWEVLASKGMHLAAVGGSDDHKAGLGENQTQSSLGSPTTLIFAPELSVAALTKALKEGRTVVKLRGPADPMLVLEASGLDRRGDTVVAESTQVKATVTGGAGHTLVWVENGVQLAPVPITTDDFEATRTLTAPEGRSARLRAEVRETGVPRTVSSHVWVSKAWPPLPPVETPVQLVPSCVGCTSSSGLAVGAMALLAFRPRRRTAR